MGHKQCTEKRRWETQKKEEKTNPRRFLRERDGTKVVGGFVGGEGMDEHIGTVRRR